MAKQMKHNDAERKRMVCEFRAGGLGGHAFCWLHGISRASLDNWLREFNESSEGSAFVPVRVEPLVLPTSEDCLERGASARIVGPRGIALEFAPGADAAWVAAICGRLL